MTGSLALTALAALAALLVGALAWTFAEYALHNWRGHRGKGKNLFSREHLRHHAETHYFSPMRIKLAVTVPVLALAVPVALIVAGYVLGGSFALGFTASAIGYEVLHKRLHTYPPRNAYGRWARRHHFAHHFRCPNHNHGVTSPLWDIVFRTWQPVEGPLRVPRKHAMPWLLDPATGEVRSELAGDYVLAGRRRDEEAAAASDRQRRGLGQAVQAGDTVVGA